MAEGGDGQDLCTFFASFIDQRQQIEQLINWLRDSQTYCTDTNCFDSISGHPGTEQGAPLTDDGSNYDCQEPLDQTPLGMVLLLVFSVLTLYFMSMNRNRPTPTAEPAKKSDDGNGPSRRNGRDPDNQSSI